MKSESALLQLQNSSFFPNRAVCSCMTTMQIHSSIRYLWLTICTHFVVYPNGLVIKRVKACQYKGFEAVEEEPTLCSLYCPRSDILCPRSEPDYVVPPQLTRRGLNVSTQHNTHPQWNAYFIFNFSTRALWPFYLIILYLAIELFCYIGKHILTILSIHCSGTGQVTGMFFSCVMMRVTASDINILLWCSLHNPLFALVWWASFCLKKSCH